MDEVARKRGADAALALWDGTAADERDVVGLGTVVAALGREGRCEEYILLLRVRERMVCAGLASGCMITARCTDFFLIRVG